MANKDSNPNSLVDPAEGANIWKTRWTLARTNQDRMFKRFADWYDALYAQIGRVPSPWRSKIYVPVLAKQTWTLLAKFLSLKPGFEVKLKDDEDLDDETPEQRAEKMQKKLDFDWDNNYFDETMRDKLFSPLLDALVTGTGMAKVPWSVVKEKKYSKLKDANTDTIDLKKHKLTEKTHGFNDLIPINIFGVFISPTAKNLYNSPWIIIREYKPIAELEAVNEAEGHKVYKNLDRLNGKAIYDTYAAYDRSRNRLLANADPTDKTVRMVATYECYEKSSNMIYTYAEGGASGGSGDKDEDQGWTLIREQENPYWHGKYPLVKFHVKKKGYGFWGEGIFEVTYRLQAGYNDIVNHYIDAMNVAFDPMLLAPEDANVDDYTIQPAGLVQYQGNVAPVPFKHLAPAPEQLQTPLQLFDQAIEGVTIPQYAAGVPNDSADTTKGTASGILRLQQAAGDVITFMRQNYMQSMVQIGKMWMSNNQQFMLTPVKVAVNRPEGPETLTINPLDIQGDMELTIEENSMNPLTQQDKVTIFKAWQQDLMGMQNQSIIQNKAVGTPPMAVDWNKISEAGTKHYDMLDFSQILMPEAKVQEIQQQQMAAAAQHVQSIQQQNQQQAQGESKTLAETLQIKFTDLPEDVQQRLIPQMFGFQAQEPTTTEKNLKVKAMGAVTNALDKGHGMQMDKMNLAHDVVKSDMNERARKENLIMEQQQAQEAQSGGEAGQGSGAVQSETPEDTGAEQ